MSTFEAIARSLATLENLDIAPLVRALRMFRDRTLWARGTIAATDVEGGIPAGIDRHDS